MRQERTAKRGSKELDGRLIKRGWDRGRRCGKGLHGGAAPPLARVGPARLSTSCGIPQPSLGPFHTLSSPLAPIRQRPESFATGSWNPFQQWLVARRWAISSLSWLVISRLGMTTAGSLVPWTSTYGMVALRAHRGYPRVPGGFSPDAFEPVRLRMLPGHALPASRGAHAAENTDRPRRSPCRSGASWSVKSTMWGSARFDILVLRSTGLRR
jgi:hypothetical protein